MEELHGQVTVYDWTDSVTGFTLRVAEYDSALNAKLMVVKMAGSPESQAMLDSYFSRVLAGMDLGLKTKAGEAPLYYWVRAMKVRNRLSFEDGEYHIPDTLASCIVRCPGARTFVQLLS